MEQIKKWKIIIVGIISLIIPVLIEKFYYNQQAFLIDRAVLFFLLSVFICMHFLFNPKLIWDKIYKKRYIIGCLVFIFIVVNGYHGSSISIYNNVIQGNIQVENGNPLIGVNRTIRSDEWAVTNPSVLSQTSNQNDFSEINHTLMAKDKPVNFYMKLPTKDISILGTPSMIFFLFLPVENAFSAYWNMDIFIMFFGTFELLMILTNKKKLWSLAGTIAVLFSPATQWWEAFDIIAYGEVAVIAFYQFLKTDKLRNKIIYSIIVGLAGAAYIMALYPAWMVPYGYFFLAIIIWMMHKQKNNYKVKDFLILLPIAVTVMAIIIIPAFLDSQEIYYLTTHTVYPGERLSTGGFGWEKMLNFFSNIFLPFNEVSNASEMSQFISFYPLPILMSIYYCIKNYRNKTKDLLLILLIGVSLLLGIWNFIELPEKFAQITMLSMSTVARCNITLGFVNVIMMIICLANYSTDEICVVKKFIFIFIISLVYILIGLMININTYGDWIDIKKIIAMIIVFFPIVLLLLYNRKKTNKILIFLIIIINLEAGILVHPLNKGLGTIFDKPISNKIDEIVNKDPDGIWITAFTPFYFQNYVAANGAPILNSTNYVPNYDLWKIVDKEGNDKNIYNRYSHINITLTNNETELSLGTEDRIDLKLSTMKIKDLNIKYILTIEDISEFSNDIVTLKSIYEEDGIRIYKVID